MTLVLPWPPSMNHYWQSMVAKGRKPRVMTYISQEGKLFSSNVYACVCELGIRSTLVGRLSVSVRLYQPNARKCDIDNRVKPLLDALTKARVWEDDEQIDRLIVSRGPIDREKPRVEVRIATIAGRAERTLF